MKLTFSSSTISSITSCKPITLIIEGGVRGFIAIATIQVYLKFGTLRQKVSYITFTKPFSNICKMLIYHLFASNLKAWNKNSVFFCKSPLVHFVLMNVSLFVLSCIILWKKEMNFQNKCNQTVLNYKLGGNQH